MTTLKTATRLKSRQAQGSLHLLEEALAPIHVEMERATERMFSQLDDPIVRKVAYLVAAGGKRLRPALVLLSGMSGPSPNREALIEVAAAVELIHTATLIHDDIIDQSALRRQQPTFHQRWGTERAVLMGDYLYATAFTLLTRLGIPYVSGVMALVCQQLARGELREVEARFRLDLSEAEYLDIIRDKTASLIGGCTQVGAYLGGLAAEHIQGFADFGVNIGLAFQITDDCLDLIGDKKHLGKAVHVDLDKGALSLPIIYLSQVLSSHERDKLFAPLQQHNQDPEYIARIARVAQATGAITKAQACADALIRVARDAILRLPVDGRMQACQQLAEYIVSRRS